MFQEEIQQQKVKLERVEKERNELRLNTDRLESRVGPVACDNACWENVVLRLEAQLHSFSRRFDFLVCARHPV